MFGAPKPPKPSEQIAKYYRTRFNVGFRNHACADANPGFFPCPLVASLSDEYYYGSMMSGVITPEEMDAVAVKFDKEMENVARRDNHEEVRACILERLWLSPYGKAREEQRARREKEKKRREYNEYVQRLKERELEKKAREQAVARRATEELEEGEVAESPPIKQEQRAHSLAPKRGRAANASWRVAAGAKKRPRVLQDNDSD